MAATKIAQRVLNGLVNKAVHAAERKVMDFASGRTRTPRKRQRTKSRSRSKSRKLFKARKVRMQSRGYTGKFRRLKRASKRVLVPAKNGSIKEIEIGGTVSSRVGTTPADERRVVYLGHTTFDQLEMWKAVVRGIVKQMANTDGIYFSNWKDQSPYGNVTFWRMDYQSGLNGPNGFVQTGTGGFAGVSVGDTWELIADKCSAAWSNCQAEEDQQIVPFRVAVVLSDNTVQCTLDLRQSKINLDIKSAMHVQNRTLASIGEGDLITDVANNPVHGRRYMASGNGLRLRSQVGSDGITPPNPILGWNADVEKLLVGGTPNGVIHVTPLETSLRKPPNSTYFINTKMTARAKINPGEIKTSYVQYKRVMLLQNFMKEFRSHLFDLKNFFSTGSPITDKHYSSLGNVEVMAFEKLLDSRVDEPTISLGYEVNYCVKCSLTIKKNYGTVQLVDVRPDPYTTEV